MMNSVHFRYQNTADMNFEIRQESVSREARRLTFRGAMPPAVYRVALGGLFFQKMPYKDPEKKRASDRAWYEVNKQKKKAQSKAHYDTNKENRKAQKDAWRDANKDRIKETDRKYREENRELIASYFERRYRENKDLFRGRVLDWMKRNPNRVRLYSHNRRARLSGGKITKERIQYLLKIQKGRCCYCGTKFTETGYHVDHIIPLALGGTNTDYNIQLLCPTCNLKKGAKDPIRYRQSQGFLL